MSDRVLTMCTQEHCDGLTDDILDYITPESQCPQTNFYRKFLLMLQKINSTDSVDSIEFRFTEILSYLIKPVMHRIIRPVVGGREDVIIPPVKWVQLVVFIQKLMAPPAAPQASGRIMHVSVWSPRSTHWLFVRLTLTALFTYNKRIYFFVVKNGTENSLRNLCLYTKNNFRMIGW